MSDWTIRPWKEVAAREICSSWDEIDINKLRSHYEKHVKGKCSCGYIGFYKR